MYTASSSVSAPPRPLRPMGAGGGPYLAPHAGAPVQGPGRARRGAGPGAGPLSGRIDLSGPQGAQVRMAIASVQRICP
ncbi:aminoglycoside phosphotransferase family protein, partial [Streptomyces sp. SID7982]|nr:aminoglycoside phosphotransferase family protein [Streptomyces sp. SID7982]